jgi:hemolysin activation/secretion protein
VVFTLAAVNLVGVETLPADALAPAYADLLAQTISTAQAAGIANRITEIYREAGYVLSRAFVPPQVVETGVLMVQIVEGYVSEVIFEGAENLPTDLSAYSAYIQSEKPLTLATLERNILLINDLSGIDVARSNLEETEEGSGEFILTLAISYDSVDATAYFDNRGTPAVGRLQGWFSTGANSVLGLG